MDVVCCRLCGGKELTHKGAGVFLSKYTSQYYQCKSCAYLFVHPVTWLDEAYKIDTTGIDTGRFLRNQTIMNVIKHDYPHVRTILDFGSGYEMLLAKESRGTPFVVTSYDKYIPTINQQSSLTQTYNLVVSAEVFEHIMNPLAFLKQSLKMGTGSVLLTTTVMSPQSFPHDKYYSRECGQHIGFLTPGTLNWLKTALDVNVHHTILHEFHFISLSKKQK